MNLLCAVMLGLFVILSLLSGAQSRHHHHSPRHSSCFPKEIMKESLTEIVQQVIGKHMRWDNYPAVSLVATLESIQERKQRKRREDAQHRCPDLQNKELTVDGPVKDRSLSPWSYRIDYDENRYPQKLAFAECLCSGCIDKFSGHEVSSLNSVPIEQTMMVLRKKHCLHKPSQYMFELDYIKVPVGCTCVIPRN